MYFLSSENSIILRRHESCQAFKRGGICSEKWNEHGVNHNSHPSVNCLKIEGMSLNQETRTDITYMGVRVPYLVVDLRGNLRLDLGSSMWVRGWGGESQLPSVLETSQELRSQKA